MFNSRSIERSDILRRLPAIAARVILGLGFSLILSMVGLAVAWGLYIFSGSSTRLVWLIMLMAGASVGAGVGAYLGWLKLDRQYWPTIIATVLVAIVGGLLGALAGYEYGVNREIDCCAEPRTGPFTFAALGSAALANVSIYLVKGGGILLGMFRTGGHRSSPR